MGRASTRLQLRGLSVSTDCTEPDFEGTRLAEILGDLPPVAADPPAVPSVTTTGPPEAVRERLEAALDASIDRCARCKVCDTQIGAAMTVLGPLLERAEAAEAKLAAQGEYETYWRALWIIVRQLSGSVFLTSAQMEAVPLLASLGVGREPRGIRINASEEP
jgi:hypothetical protein